MADISYTRTTWADGAEGGTAIDATKLNNIEQGVVDAVAAIGPNDTTEDGTLKAQIDSVRESVSQSAIVLDNSNSLPFYGYVTAGAKDVIMYIPVPALGKTSVSASGGAVKTTFRGGTGSTREYTFGASSASWSMKSGGLIVQARITLDTAYSGGNNVAIVGYMESVTLSFS